MPSRPPARPTLGRAAVDGHRLIKPGAVLLRPAFEMFGKPEDVFRRFLKGIACNRGDLGRSPSVNRRRHPLALRRPRFDRLGFETAAGVQRLAHGDSVRTAGLVIMRQRPGTATGVVFVTLEGETGYVNQPHRAEQPGRAAM